MIKSRKSKKWEVIEAAGGIVTRLDQGKQRVALIHRPKYDDWTLPKGWREKGETWSDAALREVREETNCTVMMKEFAGCTSYNVGIVPKIVLFWHMDLVKEGEFDSSGETDQLVWVEIDEARLRLSYEGEIHLIDSWFPGFVEEE